MTTTTPERPTTRGSSTRPELAPTLGPQVCRWIERYCVLGEGDFYGQPVRLRPWQRAFLYRLYELRLDGSRRYRRALFGVPKGNGKTPLAAWIAAVELAGPCVFSHWDQRGRPVGRRRLSPLIPVGAASDKQADLVFGDLRNVCENEASELHEYVEVFTSEVQLRGEPGKAFRVAAARGTNDGGRPSCFIADELHEWITPAQTGAHLVITNGMVKRADSLELAITTAGSDKESLLGRMYQYGLDLQAGKVDDDEFLFVWYEAPKDVDLKTPEGIRSALRACNPAADDFLDVDKYARKLETRQVPEFEWRRYYLNQWTSAAESWLPTGAWETCQEPALELDPTLPVWVGVDIALKHDSSAVTVVQPQGEGDARRFVVRSRVWRPEGGRVDFGLIEAHLRQLHRQLDVREFTYDPAYFERSAQDLLDEGLPMVEFPQSPQRMVPACQEAYQAITSKRVAHDGDPSLTDHVESAAPRTSERGWTLSKGRSKRKIDACIAMVIALHRATQPVPEPMYPSASYA